MSVTGRGATALDDERIAAVIREFGREMREITSGLDEAMSRWNSAHRNSLRPIRIILGCLSKINFLRNVDNLGKLSSFEGVIDKAIVKNLGLLDKLLPKLMRLAHDFESAMRKMRLVERRMVELQRRAAHLITDEKPMERRLEQLVRNVDSLAKNLREIVSMYEAEYLFRRKVLGNIGELPDPRELYTSLLLWTMEPYLESDRIEEMRREIGVHLETMRTLVSRQNFSPTRFM